MLRGSKMCLYPGRPYRHDHGPRRILEQMIEICRFSRKIQGGLDSG